MRGLKGKLGEKYAEWKWREQSVQKSTKDIMDWLSPTRILPSSTLPLQLQIDGNYKGSVLKGKRPLWKLLMSCRAQWGVIAPPTLQAGVPQMDRCQPWVPLAELFPFTCCFIGFTYNSGILKYSNCEWTEPVTTGKWSTWHGAVPGYSSHFCEGCAMV